ncbi:MAG TPA: glycosyltransferase [Terriglobales bacterium]|jgi:GT2 family glycosyltransferase
MLSRDSLFGSIVVCTRQRAGHLEGCLEALSSCRERAEVIVVDNSAGDRDTEAVARRWQACYVVEPDGGLNNARNRGARETRSEFIAYIDDDAHPQAGWLAALLRPFEDPQVMASAGQIVVPADTAVASLIVNAKPASARVIDKATPGWFEIANFGGIGIGCNMAFRRRAFDVWPGFDERLDRGTLIDAAGESYAFFSLIKSGYRIAYTPDAVVTHPHQCAESRLQARYRKDFASATAYMTLLFWEHPAYRRQLIRYVLDSLRGTQRTWRVTPVACAGAVPRAAAFATQLLGPWLYLRTRLRYPALGHDDR